MRLQPEKHVPWLAGFFLSVNLYLIPSLASSPRATDLIGAVLAVWVLWRLAHGRQDPRALATMGFLALSPLIWLFFSTLGGDAKTGVLAARWLLAIPWALGLMLLVDQEERQVKFAQGIVMGGLANTAVIVLQWQGLESLLQLVGLSSAGANYHQYVAYTVRIPGLHGQHNASSSVISLLIPAGFFLYFKGCLRLSHLLAALFALLISLHLTSTRSPLVVAVLTTGLASLLAKRMARSLMIGFIIFSFLIPLVVVYGPPGGWARWKNTEALVSNFTERADSTLGALSLALENPQGLGVERGRIQLGERTGLGATHNAFLQAALVFGLPFGLMVSLGFLLTISRSVEGVDGSTFLSGLVAFHVAGLFMFEEHLNNPTFMILAAWLIGLGLTQGFRSAFRNEKYPADLPTGIPTQTPE